MADVEIRPFRIEDEDAVISVILPIQREEFDIDITVDLQPDLRVIPDFYQTGKGEFLVALVNDKIVGTVGLKDIGNGQTALRKMFVSSEMRGPQYEVARKLLDALLKDAKAKGVTEIFLGTTVKFLAAHRFYEKNGFTEIDVKKLPRSFPVMKIDSKFYHLKV